MSQFNNNSTRGRYQALEERNHDDTKDDVDEDVTENKRSGVIPLSEVSFTWLYYLLSAFAGFVMAIVFVNIFPGTVTDQQSGNAKSRGLLRIPRHEVVFQANKMFSSPPNRENNAAWDESVGPSIGLIAIKNSKSYGLPSGAKAVNDDSANVYQVTFAHQIQCLSLLRTVHFSENKGIFNTTTFTPSPAVQQANQCFDFLMQSIRCTADMTLESQTDEGGNFNGWGEKRMCARWDRVMEFMRVNEYKEAEKAVDHHAHGDDDDDDDK